MNNTLRFREYLIIISNFYDFHRNFFLKHTRQFLILFLITRYES